MYDSGESLDVFVCHTINTTSLSICHSHDSSVCHPKCDSTWNLSVHQHVHHQFHLSDHQLNSQSKYPGVLLYKIS